jgi:predicted PurR-regulated permease PerM
MNIPSQPEQDLEQRLAAPLLDVLIRAGLILALAMLCYQVFSPFLTLMVWALILAVTLYPLHQALARRIGGKQGLAATLLVIVGLVLFVVPTAMLLSSLGDSVHHLVRDVQNNTLKIPAPRPGVATWPVVGKKLYAVWSKAHADLPALVQSMQPKMGAMAKTALSLVASIGEACCSSWSPASLPASSWPSGRRAVVAARPSSRVSLAPHAAAHWPVCPRRPCVPSPKG